MIDKDFELLLEKEIAWRSCRARKTHAPKFFRVEGIVVATSEEQETDDTSVSHE